jgi:hypothetical protein
MTTKGKRYDKDFKLGAVCIIWSKMSHRSGKREPCVREI